MNADFSATHSCLDYTFTSEQATGTHTWNFGDGSPEVNEPTVSHSFMQGSYTVTHTVTDVCGTTTAIMFVNPMDCPSNLCNNCQTGGTDFDGGMGTNASNLGLGNLTAGDCISIAGKVLINTDLTWNGVTVYLDPGAEIEVSNNVIFTVENCTFEGCTEMWKGLTIIDGGKLVFTENTIRDAQYAIQVINEAELEVQGNTFENNFVGLFVPSQNWPNVTTINNTLPFINNTFIGTSSLLGTYPGQEPVPVANSSQSGIFLQRVGYFSVGTEGGSGIENTFSNLRTGVMAVSTNLDVYNADFKNIVGHGCGNDLYNCKGTSAYARWGDEVKVINSNIYHDQQQIFTGGVKSVYSKLTVSGCDFTHSRGGVNVLGANENDDILIDDNDFDVEQSGVSMFWGRNCKLDVTNNRLTFPPGGQAHGYYGLNFWKVEGSEDNYGNINYNTISHNNRIRSISVSTSKYLNLEGNIIDMDIDNQFNYLKSDQMMFFEGSSFLKARYNHLNSNGNESTPTNNTIDYVTGIDIWNTTDSKYCCNYIGDEANGGMDQGIRFVGPCTGTELRGTQLGTLFDAGLRLGIEGGVNATEIGPQGDNQNYYGNRWLNGTASGGAVHEEPALANQSTFFVNQNIPFTIPNPIPVPSNWFDIETNQPAPGSSFDCNTTQCDDVDGYAPPSPCDSYIKTADGSLESTLGYDGGITWERKRHLYKKLRETSVIPCQNQAVSQFVNTNQNTSLEAFYEVEKAIQDLYDPSQTEAVEISNKKSNIRNTIVSIRAKDKQIHQVPTPANMAILIEEKKDLLKILADDKESLEVMRKIYNDARSQEADLLMVDNNNISVTAVYETNLKQVNDILLNTVAKGVFELSNQQLVSAQTIAGQCPLSGGNAVFLARGLVALESDVVYDDDLLCASPKVEEKQKEEGLNDSITSDIQLYPNPAKKAFNVIFSAPLNTDAELRLYNVMGQLVASYPLIEGQQHHQFETTNLASGVYVCTMLQNEIKTEIGKLVIQK